LQVLGLGARSEPDDECGKGQTELSHGTSGMAVRWPAQSARQGRNFQPEHAQDQMASLRRINSEAPVVLRVVSLRLQ
jgi:hypothetical protein